MQLLNDWDLERDKVWQVVPKEMLTRLAHPIKRGEVAQAVPAE